MPRPTSDAQSGDRIRVVTLVDFLSGNAGAEHFALLIAERLNPERFESTLCVSRWPPPPEAVNAGTEKALERLESAGVRFLPLGRQRKSDVWVWARLERYLRRERIQILHAHKFGSNVWGTVMGRIARTPVILAHEHTWSYVGQPLRRFLDREVVARAANLFIAVSREDQRRMIEVERIDASRTLFVPIGIVPPPPPGGRDVRAELGIERDCPVIGLTGVLRPQKAIHVLLRAVALLVARWPSLQVLVVGDGPERANLEQLSQELGLGSTVRFLGFRTDVSDVLRALDIGVCCSDFEGTPAAVLEYMDAGLPVVATSVGGIPDLIDPGVHGLLVAPGDAGALSDALAELLGDQRRAREMGQRGQQRRRAEFDLDVMVARFEELYRGLLARADGATGEAVRSL